MLYSNRNINNIIITIKYYYYHLYFIPTGFWLLAFPFSGVWRDGKTRTPFLRCPFQQHEGHQRQRNREWPWRLLCSQPSPSWGGPHTVYLQHWQTHEVGGSALGFSLFCCFQSRLWLWKSLGLTTQKSVRLCVCVPCKRFLGNYWNHYHQTWHRNCLRHANAARVNNIDLDLHSRSHRS